ncbi:MAG: winged helix-turn-helix domain-containing protein, partial [Candidatus Micrarchaeaceae archaeon]
MSVHGATKKEILRLIARGDNTLSAISSELGLAPSTVSKHLHDLEADHAIKQMESHFKKWKHYGLTEESMKESGNAAQQNGSAARQKNQPIASKALLASATVLALLAMLYFAGSYLSRPNSGISYVPVSITDPPLVPEGTQALYINYSSLSIYASYDNAAYVINLNSSGSLDLMSLINKSQVIGLADIRPGSVVSRITFNVTSARIIINNVTYGVYLPQRVFTALVDNKIAINSSSNILIDFAPTVAPLNIYNATAFALAPALQAAVFSNQSMRARLDSGRGMPSTFPLAESCKELFRNPPQLNIGVEEAQLKENGSNLSLSVMLNNSGAANITIISLLLEKSAGTALWGPVMPMPYGASIWNFGAGMGAGNWHAEAWAENSTAGNAQPNFYEQSNSSLVVNISGAYYRMLANGSNTITIALRNPANIIQITGFGNATSGAFVEGY